MAAAAVAGEIPGPAEVLELIAANPRLAAAAADVDAARSGLDAAGVGMRPYARLHGSAKHFDSLSPRSTTRDDLYGRLEVVQPLYDFGLSSSRRQAARADIAVAQAAGREVRNELLLEGLGLYYELHASDLFAQARREEFTLAYLRYQRALERESTGDQDPIDTLARQQRSEQTRLGFYRERSRNSAIRLRLAELAGRDFTALTAMPPLPPRGPRELDFKRLLAALEADNPELAELAARRQAVASRRRGLALRPKVEAFGNLGESNRELRGRDRWGVGARVVVPLYEGGAERAEAARLAANERRLAAEFEAKRRELDRRLRLVLLARADGWQQLVAARANHRLAQQRLLRQRTQYDQDEVADLGRSAIALSDAEGGLAQAAGHYLLVGARLAVLLGRTPLLALGDNYLEDMKSEEP